MILIPYFWDTSSPNWLKLGIFLCSGGRQMWSVDHKDTDKQIRKLLKDNDFPVVSLEKRQDAIYARIDPKTLKLEEFYMWDEIDPKRSEEDVWRIFQIPKALWTCPVFKEHFAKSANLPIDLSALKDE